MLASLYSSRFLPKNSYFKTRIYQASSQLVRTREMKRKAGPTATNGVRNKRRQIEVPDYCDVEPVKDEDGSIIWPAPRQAIEEARGFLREW